MRIVGTFTVKDGKYYITGKAEHARKDEQKDHEIRDGDLVCLLAASWRSGGSGMKQDQCGYSDLAYKKGMH